MSTHPNTSIIQSIFYFNLIMILILHISCNHLKESTPEIKRNLDFNNGWRFLNENIDGAENLDFDDSSWRTVDLPQDWSVEDYSVQDSLHIGPFYKNMERGHDVGYLRGGIGWYRKKITLTENDENKQVFLHFDGVQSETVLFVNGKAVGKHVYGYTPFYFNITPFLNEVGAENQLAIKVINPEQNSRWFAGAGIYRPVTISFLNPVHVDIWGVAVTTAVLGDTAATVNLDLTLANQQENDADVTIQAAIHSPQNKTIQLEEQNVRLQAGKKVSLSIKSTIEKPALWDLETPQLYTAKISLLQNGEIVDEYETPFGIRSIEFSAEKGFLLNGKKVLMKGACLHHDNGLLGAAAFDRAEERRVQIMKKNGYNAMRTSHNPPSQAFLDACDRLGVLVIDESFDMWLKPKRPNDYHRHYQEWWKKDTEVMLLRDRNHPCVIMWSIGNEIQERADASGLAIAKAAIAFIKSIDSSRPVTMAICDFWDNPGKTWDDTAPAFALLDVGGYNYQWQKYEKDHEKYPRRIMFGSESVAQHAFENWQLVEKLPYVIGDFVWTGMDYIGEAGIGHSTYQPEKDAQDRFHTPWPWYISWCGDIDIVGHKKPQSFYRDVVWGERQLEMAVHEPVPEGQYELIHFWGWPKEFQSWNWQGSEGIPLEVTVYSSYPKVRLTLNDTLIGEKEITAESKLKASFTVPYEEGELKVSGIMNGTVQESKIFKTTGPVAGLKLEPERTEIKDNRGEIVYVNLLAVDGNGDLVPNANLPITLRVFGEGELLAAGNASPLAEGSLQDQAFNLYNGRGLVIIRSTGKPGAINIEAKSDAIGLARVTIAAKN